MGVSFSNNYYLIQIADTFYGLRGAVFRRDDATLLLVQHLNVNLQQQFSYEGGAYTNVKVGGVKIFQIIPYADKILGYFLVTTLNFHNYLFAASLSLQTQQYDIETKRIFQRYAMSESLGIVKTNGDQFVIFGNNPQKDFTQNNYLLMYDLQLGIPFSQDSLYQQAIDSITVSADLQESNLPIFEFGSLSDGQERFWFVEEGRIQEYQLNDDVHIRITNPNSVKTRRVMLRVYNDYSYQEVSINLERPSSILLILALIVAGLVICSVIIVCCSKWRKKITNAGEMKESLTLNEA
eukprot:TRINITY_DN3857_c0_g3_i3.p1 TRINITY_DN3857_c0_g3~~TRINITY_DN3857_c0_g3_i3.p1  ORF type:complete len:294 (-),score=39.71 TRINITY_DN3857_c0_g3_i3:129-1010(-)